MGQIAVRVQNLGKRYRIGARTSRVAPLLTEQLTSIALAPFTRLAAAARRIQSTSASSTAPTAACLEPATPYVWALRGVSFEVEQGQTVGIIGPNGAGKSTLLKILSRITEPTEGRIEIHGRVASLLEVGTGFHPELTGRENIYLSGALLGMKKAETDRKLDEIIEFCGITKFIDTPVKHYSSGMYVRLAFSVAAHLESDILIVDEVLAVGDVPFQRKCLAKMEDVRQHGRTVLFVSHSMSAVARLCARAILISEGVVQKDGASREIVSTYVLSGLHAPGERTWADPATAPGATVVRLRSVRVRSEDGGTIADVDIRRPLGLEMVFDVLKPGHALIPYFELHTETGICVFATQDLDAEWRRRGRPVGCFVSTAWVPGNFLTEGTFLVTAGVGAGDPPAPQFFERDTIAFRVVDSFAGDSARGDYEAELPGVVRPLLKWTDEFKPQLPECDAD